MALSDDDIKNIHALIGRQPTDVELSIFDTMWSEHCSYKSTKPSLKTLPTDGPNIMLGVGEDSGIIYFTTHQGERYGIAVSHESHNHPSQILPIEGAATGVGGVVRDVYCMGADVIGILDSLHFGLDSKHNQPVVDHIAEQVVLGIADYCNPLGVPNVGGETIYHSSYNDNCLVNVAAIGLVKESRIIRSRVPKNAASEDYVMILIGKTTDSTGYGGASFSSAVLDASNDQQNLGAVQVHDPFIKRLLVVSIEAMLGYVHQHNIDIGFKDLGAGGISCATSELAIAGGFGCELELDNVPVVDASLSPEIIACSETQERFCVAVPEQHASAICAIFNEQFALGDLYPGAGAAVIGRIIQDKKYIIKYKQTVVCDLPIASITTDVSVARESASRTINRALDGIPTVSNYKELCLSMLQRLNSAQKKYVYRHFDQFVKNNGVMIPGEGDACILAPIRGCDAGVAVTIDSNVYGNVDPYGSGAYAVAEAIRNVISVGATPIALTDCLNYGNPENPSVFFDFTEGVRGIGDAARQLSVTDDVIPIISGNVSLYNDSTDGEAVVPSPVICCIGQMDDATANHPMQLSIPNARIMMLGHRYNEFAATLVSEVLNESFHTVPQVRFDDEKPMNQAMLAINQANAASAVHDVSQGGCFQALVEMMLGDRNWPFVGVDVHCPAMIDPFTLLFSENAGYLCEVSDEKLSRFKKICNQHGVYFYEIGQTTDAVELTCHYNDQLIVSLSINEIMVAWNAKNLACAGTPIYNEALKE